MTKVVVIGGGVTGCSIARDLSMRGATVTLLERDRLNVGTSGRSHNMLHSGARYADVEPAAAVACKDESAILKRIGGAAITDTGGVFVAGTEAEHQFIEEKKAACRSVGIPVDVIEDDSGFRDRNPGITDSIEGLFRVPDSVIRPDALVAATIHSAVKHGATVRCDAEVINIRVRNQTATGVVINFGSDEVLTADFIVNAAGPWAGEVADLAGITLDAALTRGTILEVNHSGIRKVINRCRPPSDGDILVPVAGGVLAGTTSVPVNSPSEFEPTEAEISTIVQQASVVIPELSTEQCTRVYGGIRPLFGNSEEVGEREMTRQYQLIDHGADDGIDRFVSVVGGKFTTHRLIAERVGDHVAEHESITTESHTASTALPSTNDANELDALISKYVSPNQSFP